MPPKGRVDWRGTEARNYLETEQFYHDGSESKFDGDNSVVVGKARSDAQSRSLEVVKHNVGREFVTGLKDFGYV